MDERLHLKTVGANHGRHERNCKICSHPQKTEIEQDFVRWKSPAKIAKEYRIANRASVYRHANAFGLFDKRARNVRAALEFIIEQASDIKASSGAVVQAAALYARINSQGQLIDPSQQLTSHDIFASMSDEELEAYAKDGTLDPRLKQALTATTSGGPSEQKHGQTVENKG